MNKLFYIIHLLLAMQAAFSQENFYNRLADSAMELTKDNVQYDPSYFQIDYPIGDIPPGKGVCNDVIIRAYRKLGIDLQKKVHEDMKNNFELYPDNCGLSSPDKNIDHRRVPNLMTFFSRHGNIDSIKIKQLNFLPALL